MADLTMIQELTRAVEKRCNSYLQEEMNLPVTMVDHAPRTVKSLALRDMTSLVSLGGDFGVYIAFSFDEKVIEDIFTTYTADIDIDPDERDMYVEETAGDVINTVIGNAMADVPGTDQAITLTPPVVLSRARSIVRHKDAYFYMMDFITDRGVMSVMYIGPVKFFTENLDYRVD